METDWAREGFVRMTRRLLLWVVNTRTISRIVSCQVAWPRQLQQERVAKFDWLVQRPTMRCASTRLLVLWSLLALRPGMWWCTRWSLGHPNRCLVLAFQAIAPTWRKLMRSLYWFRSSKCLPLSLNARENTSGPTQRRMHLLGRFHVHIFLRRNPRGMLH